VVEKVSASCNTLTSANAFVGVGSRSATFTAPVTDMNAFKTRPVDEGKHSYDGVATNLYWKDVVSLMAKDRRRNRGRPDQADSSQQDTHLRLCELPRRSVACLSQRFREYRPQIVDSEW
jgi:hypothetical protein